MFDCFAKRREDKSKDSGEDYSYYKSSSESSFVANSPSFDGSYPSCSYQYPPVYAVYIAPHGSGSCSSQSNFVANSPSFDGSYPSVSRIYPPVYDHEINPNARPFNSQKQDEIVAETKKGALKKKIKKRGKLALKIVAIVGALASLFV